MATVMFIGDPNHEGSDPPRVTMFGLTFELGVPVWVEDVDHLEAMSKIRGNNHFLVADQPRELIGPLWEAQIREPRRE